MEIRQYQPKDKENARMICIETANGFDTESESVRKLLVLLYNDYYTENESEHCFVAVNDDDEAIGYILCSVDREKFEKTMNKVYLPQVRKLSFGDFFTFKLSQLLDKFLSKKYPAHLHIDILDGYQRMGIGTKLMDTLFEDLRKSGVKGVMLGVSSTNQKGINFYKKLGFKQLFSGFGGIVMGYTFE